MSSILNDVKKNLDIDPSDTAFDPNVILLINGALSELNQLGVGPEGGLFISDATTQWSSLIGTDPRWNIVKTWVFLTVKMVFDPPGTGALLTAFTEQLNKMTWRIGVLRESIGLVEAPTVVILDGGVS